MSVKVDTPEISIIVPVYNSERFLSECIESVLCQTFRNFELLLIDDGSSDGSKAIIEKYEKSDIRVRGIYKTNGGVSSARNTGLDQTKGEWIIFLDSDDFWTATDALEKLLITAKNNDADVVRGEYVSVDTESKIVSQQRFFNTDSRFINKNVPSGKFLKECVGGEFFSVLWLIKRDKISKLRFNEKQSFLEDMRFLVELSGQPLNCIYIDFPFYAYRKYNSLGSSSYNLNRIENSFGMCDTFWEQTKKDFNDNDYVRFCKYYAVMMYCWTIRNIADDIYFKNRIEIIKVLDLNKLHFRTKKRLRESGIHLSFKDKTVLSLNPILSSWLLRINLIILRVRHRIIP